MSSKMHAVTNTSAHHFGSALGTVGEPSPTAVVVTRVPASWAAKSSEFKRVVPDSLGLAGTNEALSICFPQCRHDKVHLLEDTRDGRVRYLSLQRASIVAMRVQESHAHTSSAEAIGDANHRVYWEAVPDEILRLLLFVVILMVMKSAFAYRRRETRALPGSIPPQKHRILQKPFLLCFVQLIDRWTTCSLSPVPKQWHIDSVLAKYAAMANKFSRPEVLRGCELPKAYF